MAPSDGKRKVVVKDPTPAVLVFHKLQASFSFGATNFSPRRFAALLHWLALRREEIVVTIDDGYQHLTRVLPPLMEKYQFHPVVFVPTGWIGKSNSWDYSHWFSRCPHLERREIREMANLGVRFGSHGHSHQALTALSDRMLKMELRQSREMLSELAAQEIRSISYPFGRCDQRVLEAVDWAGYTAGYTMSFPAPDEPPLAQGRIPVYGFDTMLTVSHKLGAGVPYQIEKLKARITNQLSGGTILLNRLRRLD